MGSMAGCEWDKCLRSQQSTHYVLETRGLCLDERLRQANVVFFLGTAGFIRAATKLGR